MIQVKHQEQGPLHHFVKVDQAGKLQKTEMIEKPSQRRTNNGTFHNLPFLRGHTLDSQVVICELKLAQCRESF